MALYSKLTSNYRTLKARCGEHGDLQILGMDSQNNWRNNIIDYDYTFTPWVDQVHGRDDIGRKEYDHFDTFQYNELADMK